MEVDGIVARIEQVTVYTRGARVRRVTTITATLPQRLRITGLPLAVSNDTIRAFVSGPAIATNVRVGLDAPSQAGVEEDSAELRAARRDVALAETEHERIEAAISRIESSSIVEQDPSDEAPAAWAAVVAARRAVIALRTERQLALQEALSAARRRVDAARDALAAASDRDHRTGTARPAKLHELRKYVEIELLANGDAGGAVTIQLEYLVMAARWAPSYVARLDGDRVGVEIRAVVAQDTGEDWSGVPMRLSTAEPSRFAVLPELAALRIGRRQQEPARPGFRAAPSGAELLYADYDRELVPLRPPSRRDDSSDVRETAAEVSESFDDAAFGDDSDLAGEVWDEESSHAKAAFSTPATGRKMPAPPAAAAPFKTLRAQQAPELAKRQRAGRGEVSDHKERSLAPRDAEPLSNAFGEGGGARITIEQAPAATVRLDYGNLVMAAPSSTSRGRLVAAPEDRHLRAAHDVAEVAAARLAGLPLPRGCHASWLHTYDYAYATDGAVDVRSDGAWHSIAVTARSTTAKVHHVAVPREQADVFRVASIANPFDGPLLPGPIDFYDQGRFLLTSEVNYTPPGASVEIGLGVDAGVKIARNTEFREETTGMLRGALRLHHTITIDVDNVSGRAVELEVRERIPVAPAEGNADIEVTPSKIDPAWERWTPDPDSPRDQRLRGGYRWRVALAAGAKRTLRAAYEVKIAGKQELVGGNRREL